MIWYARLWRWGAMLVEIRRDFGFYPIWSVGCFGGERVIDLPFAQLTWTPASVLERERHSHAPFGSSEPRGESGANQGISGSSATIGAGGSGISPALQHLSRPDCPGRGDVPDHAGRTDGAGPVHRVADRGGVVGLSAEWPGLRAGRDTGFPSGTAPEGAVPDL